MATTHPTLESSEQRRREEQVRLDKLKTTAERNKWGQFATPPELALSITRHARSLIGSGSVRFLDPAIGTGSFFSALAQTFPADAIAEAFGVELDPLFADAAKRLWAPHGLNVTQADFTQQEPPEQRFNLVLTNPPYVRHHHLAAEDKQRLRSQLARSLQSMSGLAGLYCYFLLRCHDWMEDGGLAAWLIPSEFMDVNYGVALRKYLTERVTLLQIHRFCPSDVQFTDALVSSAVVIFRKDAPPPSHEARFTFAGALERPEREALIPLDALRHARKWTQFPAAGGVVENNDITLGELFHIKRGLATGSNSFFILTEADLREHHIPRAFTKPILPGPRHLLEDVIEALPDGTPDVSPRLYLIDCKEPEERIRTTWPRFAAYLDTGKKLQIDASYLASRRAPWYSQEQGPAAPFLCTYMGRARNGEHPFRFIWNRSKATAHNVYLMLYPTGRLRDVLMSRPELERRVFQALQNIHAAQFITEGRVYGGGLHKVEPKELGQICARSVLDALKGQVIIEEQLRIIG